VKPWPLLMVGVYVFLLALLAFSLALVAQTAPPPWIWALNAVAAASGALALGYWCRLAARS